MTSTRAGGGPTGSGPEIDPVTVEHPVDFQDGYPMVDNRYNTATKFKIRCTFAGGAELLIRHDTENGVLITGTKGRIFVNRGKLSSQPESIIKQPIGADEMHLYESPGHHRDWLDACKNGGTTVSNFKYAAKLTEFVLLGNLAIRAGKRIHWDSKNMKVKGMSQLDPFIRESYVPEWDLAKII